MSKTDFTKGKLKVFEDEDNGNLYLYEIIDEETSYIVADRISSIHDANLFKTSKNLYSMLDTVLMVLSGNTKYTVEDINIDYIKQLLAEARGEIHENN